MADTNGNGHAAEAIGRLLEATDQLKIFVAEQSETNNAQREEIQTVMNRVSRLTTEIGKLKERLDEREEAKRLAVKGRRTFWRNLWLSVLGAWIVAAGVFLASNWKSAIRLLAKILGRVTD